MFVCHGNICRSPMAEYIFRRMLTEGGRENEVLVASSATSDEEIWGSVGNPVYPPARKKMAEHGIDCRGTTARQMTKADYAHYDLLVAMDQSNLRWMERICSGDPEGKFRLLLDYTDHPRDVADPWYTGDFEATWQDVNAGCRGILQQY